MKQDSSHPVQLLVCRDYGFGKALENVPYFHHWKYRELLRPVFQQVVWSVGSLLTEYFPEEFEYSS